MNLLNGLKSSSILVILLLFLFLFFIGITLAQESNLTKNTNSSDEKNDNNTAVNQLIQLTAVLGSIAIGTLGTRYIVSNWQEKKEISEIRREILKNYQESIKDYLVLMETFVAKVVFRSVSISNAANDKGTLINGFGEMHEMLPYGYTYGLSSVCFVESVQNQTFLFSNRSEKTNKDFTNSEFMKFEEEFFSKRASITKFTSGVRQYYQNGRDLSSKLDDLWNRIMILHILLHIMIKTKEDEDFVFLLKKFNSSIEKLFHESVKYDKTLAIQKINVEKNEGKIFSRLRRVSKNEKANGL
jgi:NADH:ubiquinone oxidoreductase subunit 5 (subunit L)/multisubunit Na+/H+ antiporter MnhA subunit